MGIKDIYPIWRGILYSKITLKGLVFIVQIDKQKYTLLRKSGKLKKTPTGYDGVTICSRHKKGNGKTYYVTDALRRLADKLVRQNMK